MSKKRGQSLGTPAIILIILGVIVLAVVLIGFIFGWTNILPFLSTKNMDKVAQQCDSFCVAGSKNEFCMETRILKDGQTTIESNCALLSVIPEYLKYEIHVCPSINCNFDCTSIGGVVKPLCDSNTEGDITSVAKVEIGQRCCVPKSTEN